MSSQMTISPESFWTSRALALGAMLNLGCLPSIHSKGKQPTRTLICDGPPTLQVIPIKIAHQVHEALSGPLTHNYNHEIDVFISLG